MAKGSSTKLKASPGRDSGAGTAMQSSVGFAEMDWGAKIAWVSLHALLFLVPIAVSNLNLFGIGGPRPLTFDQFDIVKLFVMRICTIVGFGGWLISLLLRGGKVRFTKVDWLIAVFLGWVLITTFTSIHPPTALFGKYRRFEGLLSFINYAVVYFLVVQLVDRPSRVRATVRTLFFSSFLVMLYGALQYVGIEPISYGKLPFEISRSFATYGNPDLLGGFIVLMLPTSIALALSEDRVVWRSVYWVGSVLTAVVWITAFTRSAWIGGGAALIALVIAAFRQRLRLRTEDWVMGGFAAALAALVVVRSLSATNEVMNVFSRLKSIFQFGEGSALTRFQIWQAAIDAIKDRPIFGFGADTFRLVFPMYKPAAYVAVAGYISVADNVHNYPLQLASALGIPGFLLLYGLIGWMLWLSFKPAFGTEPGGARIVYSAVWAAAMGYMVHLMFGLSVTGTTVILWAFLGLLLAPQARSREFGALAPVAGYAAAAAVALIAGALFVGNVTYVMADNAYLMARVASLGPEARIEATELAVKRNPYSDPYRSEVGLAYIDAAIARLAGQYGDPATAEQDALALFQKGEQALIDAIEFAPPEYDNYVFLANLYNTMSEYIDTSYLSKAIDTARAGVAVEPYGPAIRVELARALASSGRTEEAIKEAKIAVELDPAYGAAAVLLADIYQYTGEQEKALEVLKKVQAVAPGQAGVAESIEKLEASLTAQ